MEPERRPAGAAGFSPAIVFVVLLVLVVTGAVVLMTRPDPPEPNPATTPQATPSPTTHRLTDAEAIARFKELDAARIRAFEQRDSKGMRALFVPGTAELAHALKTIQKLRRDQVLMRHEPYRTLAIRTVRNAPREVEIEQKVIFDIEFLSEQGENVTTRGSAERLTVRWTLKRHDGSWRISMGEVIAAEVAPGTAE